MQHFQRLGESVVGSTLCKNSRKETQKGGGELGREQTQEQAWEGEGSLKHLKECVWGGCACRPRMDSRVSLSARTGQDGTQGVGWYLAEREWKPGAGGPVL